MNVTLTESGYTLDGKWRLVPVECVFPEAFGPHPTPQSLSSIPPDCRTCTNRGHINGLSQETYCDGCMWYGAYWKRNHYNQMQEPAP